MKIVTLNILWIIVVAGLLSSCKSHYATSDQAYTVISTPASIENGKNIVFNVCGQCHYNDKTKAFTGTRMEELPGFLGKIYSANITGTPDGIMAKYTDAQLAYLLKTGISREGKFIPYMVRPTMADADMNDLISYLRSGDAPVKGNNASAGQTHTSGLGKLATKVSGKPLPYNTGIMRPVKTDEAANGRYLVDIMGCYHCHSKSIISLNYMEPQKSKGYMAGGMKFKIRGHKIHASNLTPDKETGIDNYTAAYFRKAVKDGEAPGGRTLSYPMRRFEHLTDDQCNAIYAYLQTLPAKHHKIKGH